MPETALKVVIVGAGLAGLATALNLADSCKVVVLVKGALKEGATPLAQGGIAAVLAEDDCVDAHVHDTQQAGAGLVEEHAARFVAASGAAAIEWLIAQGVRFSRDREGPLGLHLTREGGHSTRRIAHAADATGHAIHKALLARAAAHPNIELREHVFAIDLIASPDAPDASGTGAACCIGVRVLDIPSGRAEALAASAVVLATGGVGGAYAHTTNPAGATGDGIAMAWRAGCRVANMEFIQFHPTSLFHADARGFLITEALRGEGALLCLPDGTRFMPAFDGRAELAPRDIVARAIDRVMKTHSLDHVLLDARNLGGAFLKSHFPLVHRRCLELGIDIALQPIPVVPAAHYTCGGVMTGLDGSTDLRGLFVVGEAACTGLHGANRLASNSLLECVVLGLACAGKILSAPKKVLSVMQEPQRVEAATADRPNDMARRFGALRQVMSRDVGIVRTTLRLKYAMRQIEMLRADAVTLDTRLDVTRESQEFVNLLDCAEMIVRSALIRRESRGLHFCSDYPGTSPASVSTVLSRSNRDRDESQITPTTRIE
jgi:L-aspartate oxidase